MCGIPLFLSALKHKFLCFVKKSANLLLLFAAKISKLKKTKGMPRKAAMPAGPVYCEKYKIQFCPWAG